MEEIKVEVLFCDKYGSQLKETLFGSINSNSSKNEILTAINDLATEWFYDIAYETAKIIWIERGTDSDYDFDIFFDKYLEQCDLNWELKNKEE